MAEEDKSLLEGPAEEAEEPRKSRKWFWNERRYRVGLLAFLGFCNIYSLRVNLSVGIVAMKEFNWDIRDQGFILSSFFYGYIVTQIPGGWLASRYGGKKVFGIGVLITSILALLTPLATKLGGFWVLIFIRVLQGLAEGVTYPSIHSVWSKWAPKDERTRLATIAFSGSYAGTVISLPFSGILADNQGWPSIFYVFGTLALLWAIFWLYNVGENPSEDRHIRQDEVSLITSSLGAPHSPQIRHLPWRSMLTSGPVWAINAAHFAENWGFYTMLTLLPTYMKDVHHYELTKSGIIAALPYVVMALVVQISGDLADRLRKFFPTTTVRKVFTCTAFVAQTVFMISAGFFNVTFAVVFLTAAVGFGGFAWAGFSVNHLDIAPNYASILMGISNTFATIPGIVSPTLAGSMISNHTIEEWRSVFSISGTIYLLGAVVYGLLASGDLQKWSGEGQNFESVLSDDDD